MSILYPGYQLESKQYTLFFYSDSVYLGRTEGVSNRSFQCYCNETVQGWSEPSLLFLKEFLNEI